ncbi:ribose-5-phosphate isomerase RpiA [Haloarcula pellucida]|uniref:Ribose-5-phosphate isomerase A n=1 Tax=Haloarcula pellucida TaxID=1427151 RepID=A0A830GSF8_9EURY|nr:ribose-5-phosphate isomerase RpiA [Halomicroarcula pellucida]MBX0349200.1 ribose-5-phosphate isomerase RpiA [Halomicroarcula pellucida]GGN99488.1 ribose-5-phosphate isomerase [Halomicroarcula pellucida]
MKQGGSDAAKRAAGEAAAETAEDGMVIGLGTGSTAAHAIRAIGRQVDAGLDVVGVPTSFQSRELARTAGIPLADLDEVTVDLAIDGADEVAGGDLVKGGGAAHAREKIVDASADRFLVVADPTKMAETLSYPVPLEVLPAARTTVAESVRELGGDPDLRRAERKDGPVVTDNGNLVLDCAFGEIADPAALAADLATLPGVVEHGLFVDVADAVYVGSEDGVTVREL